jgi:hypothetical protein
MKSKLLICVAGMGLCGAGCGPLTLTARTIIVEPIEYCAKLSACEERKRDHRVAEDAWHKVACAEPKGTFSDDYARGFIEGFEDYLYAGGNGEPPALPPRDYWRAEYETVQGHQAIQDWFTGFRHGVAEARMSGYRQLVLVPASSPPMNTAQAFNPIVSGPPRDFPSASAPPLGGMPMGAPPEGMMAPIAPAEPATLPPPRPEPPPQAPINPTAGTIKTDPTPAQGGN